MRLLDYETMRLSDYDKILLRLQGFESLGGGGGIFSYSIFYLPLL